jgi:MoaA/NifB/PqqE/SkfB family radical SAM enzyme
MLTDVCNHKCAFCSVQARAGDSLPFSVVTGYLDRLVPLGLKAVILSGGGNPILYRARDAVADINDVVGACRVRGLEVGLITNGMPLRPYTRDAVKGGWRAVAPSYRDPAVRQELPECQWRESWVTVRPETLDALTWVRVSMSGLDHDECEVYVPDLDQGRTTLGFSYVAHDLYREPADPHHGKVSRPADLLSGDRNRAPDETFEERREWLLDQMVEVCRVHSHARYLRLLPNCLEPDLIARRVRDLSSFARALNHRVGREVAFVQYKPPAAPKACYLGYVHPVLNCDGWVYPCDSCVLNEAAGHSFANPWRVCWWDEVGSLYDGTRPFGSLIADPARTCPGCVFHKSNEILGSVVDGSADLTPPTSVPEHANFV